MASRDEEDQGNSLFKNVKKACRLLSTMRKIGNGELRPPVMHALNAGLNVTEDLEKRPEKSQLSKLHKRWRIESRRARTVEEMYPDEAVERQRKRLVRKTVTHIFNIASQKEHAIQQEKIAELERTPLPAPAGLKSLGWKVHASKRTHLRTRVVCRRTPAHTRRHSHTASTLQFAHTHKHHHTAIDNRECIGCHRAGHASCDCNDGGIQPVSASGLPERTELQHWQNRKHGRNDHQTLNPKP
jgi:hypothetical protein